MTELFSVVLAFSTLVLGIGAAGYWVLNEKVNHLPAVERVYLEIFAIQMQLAARPRAVALGFKDPDIQVISMRPNTRFWSTGLASPTANFELRGMLLRVEGNRAFFRIDGRVGTNTIKNVETSVRHGELTAIGAIAVPGIPTLYVAVLDGVEDRVAIAIGPASPPSKS